MEARMDMLRKKKKRNARSKSKETFIDETMKTKIKRILMNWKENSEHEITLKDIIR